MPTPSAQLELYHAAFTRLAVPVEVIGDGDASGLVACTPAGTRVLVQTDGTDLSWLALVAVFPRPEDLTDNQLLAICARVSASTGTAVSIADGLTISRDAITGGDALPTVDAVLDILPTMIETVDAAVDALRIEVAFAAIISAITPTVVAPAAGSGGVLGDNSRTEGPRA